MAAPLNEAPTHNKHAALEIVDKVLKAAPVSYMGPNCDRLLATATSGGPAPPTPPPRLSRDRVHPRRGPAKPAPPVKYVRNATYFGLDKIRDALFRGPVYISHATGMFAESNFETLPKLPRRPRPEYHIRSYAQLQ